MKIFCSSCSLLFRSQSLAQGAWSNLAQRWPAWRHEWRGKITSEHRSNNWLQNDIKGDGGVDGQRKECQHPVPWSGQVANMWCLPCKVYLVHFSEMFQRTFGFCLKLFHPRSDNVTEGSIRKFIETHQQQLEGLVLTGMGHVTDMLFITCLPKTKVSLQRWTRSWEKSTDLLI